MTDLGVGGFYALMALFHFKMKDRTTAHGHVHDGQKGALDTDHVRARRQRHDRHLPQLLPFPLLSARTWWLCYPFGKFLRMIWMSA